MAGKPLENKGKIAAAGKIRHAKDGICGSWRVNETGKTKISRKKFIQIIDKRAIIQ